MKLSELTERGSFVRTVEVLPPSFIASEETQPSLNVKAKFSSLAEKARKLGAAVDALHIADLKDSKRYHLNAVWAAADLKRLTGIETIPAIPLRDYSRSGLYGIVFSALLNGIDNLLIVRGDPYVGSERQHSKNVYDIERVSEGVRLVREAASRTSHSGCCVLGPIDISRTTSNDYLEMAKQREASGVDIFLSQPFFDSIESCLERIDLLRDYGVRNPILHNIFPLKSLEDAANCESRFGWKIGAAEKEKLRRGGIDAGLRAARERYGTLWDNRGKVNGVYISSRGVAEWGLAIMA